MNLPDLFANSLARFPDQIALAFPAAGARQTWTYRELDAAIERTAAGLVARGLAPGDRVVFFLGNRPEFVIALFAVLRLGAVMVPVNLAYRRREIAHILGDARAKLLLSDEAQRANLAELSGDDLAGAEPLLAEKLLAEPSATSRPRALVRGDDLAFLLYTSGTTGRSKGAEITHANACATVTGLLDAWAWSPEDRLLLTLPLFHTHGLVVGLCCALAAAATVELRRKFELGPVLADLAAGVATLFFGVPTMYVRLAEALGSSHAPAGTPGAVRRMRLFCSGSAPLAPETFASFRELTGHAILERYGMTETGMLLSNPYAGERRPGTVGLPLPGVSVRIVGAGERDVDPGAEGELLVRGANVFRGYWRAPEKTAESFLRDESGQAWFRTGDLARRDPATGYYSLLGRRSELILSGGFNVYPREIEEVLEALAGVCEAAVVGRPHAQFGETPVAYLVMDAPDVPGAAGAPITDADLEAWCRSQLAAFKIPRSFRRVATLPRNALGKVQKHLLPD
jgi:malonyl-CoA/methylmalonyl-CoA synthetase